MPHTDIYSSMQPVTASPWPRYVVDTAAWEQITNDVANGVFVLSGLWADQDNVHMALLSPPVENGRSEFAVITLPAPNGRYPSVAAKHLPALRLERTIADMNGIVADGCPDTRPWLDHGAWPLHHPLGSAAKGSSTTEYKFLPVEGEGLHQIPVGPIHAGIIEPGHFRFTANGETVVRLEERLGYVHKGIEKLFEGADIQTGARLAGRVSGDSTVAYAIAYSRAVEAALGVNAPARAVWLRAMMAEIERMANHFGDIGAICNDAAFSLLLAHFGILREELLRLADSCFGHRLMMDCVVPGGVAADPCDDARNQLAEWIEGAGKRFEELVAVYDDKSSLKNRTDGTGFVRPDLVRLFGAGGHVGRASMRSFDTRKHLPYAPYDQLDFSIPVLNTCDVHARLWVRVCEIRESMGMLRQILARLPKGDIASPLRDVAKETREGMAMVESFRGDVFVWLRLEGGKIARCYPRDPSWFQWPLLENSIYNNIVADFPLCNKSFNCSYSGHDL